MAPPPGQDATIVVEHGEQTLDAPSEQGVVSFNATPGQMLGRYELLSKVGQGGMGAVFTARDPDLGRTVAIKLLHAGVEDLRLEREARGLAQVSHPNVIAVYDVGRAAGRLFFAMEFVQGSTLRRWLSESERSREEILNVFMQAGRGLEAAHAAGLVHRDFKPDNVLVGDDGRVRVLDFGLVEGVAASSSSGSLRPEVASPGSGYGSDSSSGAGRLTVNGSVLGTPAYMALEQYSGAADQRTDQYSFCVALWEALYGRRPYDYASVVELLARLRSGPPPEPPPNADVPSWLERLLKRGLSRDPSARFASMSELLDLLESSMARTRAREALIGFRYRPIGTGLDDAVAAIDTYTDQQVVLKVARNAADFEVLGSCEHPNIVPVVDVACSNADSAAYLVLDLPQSRKAFDEAMQSAPLAIQLEWLSELLRAFLYLHRRGIGHAACSRGDVLVVAGHVRLLLTQLEPFDPKSTVARDLALVAELASEMSTISPTLRAFASRLREPGTEQPITDAVSALEALSRAAERPLAVETAETRESFLRALPLLKRDEVLQALKAALGALEDGRGAAFRIEGESGVGKSRLLEELRRVAVAKDVLVLEGRGDASAQSPYRVFRLPLLRLALRAGSEALDDFQLELLAPLIPELPARLGRSVAVDAARAEPSPDALIAVVWALMRQERRPLLLLLEDLQWSGSESFALLTELVTLSQTRPILIVASARNETSTDKLALPGAMQSVQLSRLDAADIAEVCATLIGTDHPVELVPLLFRETEGNAFFLVEALRALAEEAGSLMALKSAPVPNRIFAGGIQTLIRRHLGAVSEKGRPLLRLAAALGRGVDPTVLRALARDVELDSWIAECVAAAVFERVEAGRDVRIRFRHDKLREALLDELSEDERRVLHARVAAALEQTRADDPEQLGPLARHYRAAGNADKELAFAARAGEQAVRSRAFAEAHEFLDRAAGLAERAGRHDMLPELCSLRAELHAQRSEWTQAQAQIVNAFATAGRPIWEKKLGDAFFLVVQLLIHLVRSLVASRADANESERSAPNPALVRAADVQLNIALTLGNNPLALASSLLALNVAEPGRPTSIRALLLVALAARVVRLREVTKSYIAQANALLPLTTDRKDLAEALSYCGYYWIGEGKLRRAREYLLRSIAASTSIGYQLPLSWSIGQLSMCASLQGRFVEMLQQGEMCERHATAGDATHVAARCTQVLALIRLGRLNEAEQRKLSLGEASPADSPLTLAIRAATNANIELERGRLTEALANADAAHRALPWVAQVPPVWPDVLTVPLEVYLRAWQAANESNSDDAVRLARIARRRIRSLKAWAQVYPVAQPLADYYAGAAARLSQREADAKELFERARAGANARGLRYYERLGEDALALRRPIQSSAI
ncbi:MAG: serine/threonine-protein kinase PknK [Myxococcota bacterium]